MRTHGTTGERPFARLERERQALLAIGHHPSYLHARRFTRKVMAVARECGELHEPIYEVETCAAPKWGGVQKIP